MENTDKITEKISSYTDWRGDRLKQLRQIINDASPDIAEDFKWNVPVWTHNGLVCAISGFKDHVKINFFKGALLSVSPTLFNSGLDSKEHRSINFTEYDQVDPQMIAELVQAAVLFNKEGKL